jgi:hypothetical protein
MAVVFFATIADVPKDNHLYIQRKQQYENGLNKIFSYNTPVHAVISETNNYTQDLLSVIDFPFTSLYNIPSTNVYNCINKSMKEYTSMQLAVQQFPQLSDDTWIIKISGRYLITDDTFFNIVKSAPDSCNVIGKIFGEDENYIQFYTFYYAMRYKYFKIFVEEHNYVLWAKNIERHLYDFVINRKLYDTTQFVNHLGIYANIADGEHYASI